MLIDRNTFVHLLTRNEREGGEHFHLEFEVAFGAEVFPSKYGIVLNVLSDALIKEEIAKERWSPALSLR